MQVLNQAVAERVHGGVAIGLTIPPTRSPTGPVPIWKPVFPVEP